MHTWKSVSKTTNEVKDWRKFITERIQEYTDISNWHLPNDKQIGNVDFDSIEDKDLMVHLEKLIMQYIKIFEGNK